MNATHSNLTIRWFVALLGMCLSISALAQAYPSQPITLVVGFPPGGSTDITGRIVADMLRTKLGQPVIIENRSGAAGLVGARHVANAAPDGYTLVWSPEFDTTTRTLIDGASIKFSTSDLVPIGGGATSPYCLVVKGDSRWKTLEDLVEFAKANPGKLTYSSAGTGMINNVGVELFLRKLGIQVLHIPYKGGADALNAVLGGQTDMHMSSAGRIKSMVEAGRLRALVTLADQRPTGVPFDSVPTTREKGYAMPDLSLFNYLAAPKNVPVPILERLRQTFKEGLGDPHYAGLLERAFFAAEYISPEQILAAQRKYIEEMKGVLGEIK